tara:strand:+ start:757 stop:1425 length:669 start_codon:yes stop_codon:yes gene_type:complete
MSSIQKIKELLKLSNKKTYKINMYAEAILDDARVIATDAESFDIGAEVYVINDAGEVESLSEGIYTMQDGSKIRIDSESRVAGLGEEEVVEEEVVVEEELSKEENSEENKEELAEESEAEETDWAKTFEEMKDRVAELEKAVFGDKAAEKTEELSKESTELSTDVMGEIITRLNSMEEKFSGLENEPSNDGVNVSPNVNNNQEINLSKLSVKERVAYFVNKN